MEPRDDQDHLSQITTRWSLLLQANRPESADRAAQDSCADQFVEKFGMRAFRRPLSTTELADLKGLYRAHRDAPLSEPFDQAIGASQ